MSIDKEQASSALAHLAALRGYIDELLAKGISWDGVSRQFVESVNARSIPLFKKLLAAAPEVYEPFNYRYFTAWAANDNRDILLSIRRDINYVMEVGSRASLCGPDVVVPLALANHQAQSENWLDKHGREIVIGIIIAVMSGAIIYALGLH